MQKFIKNLEVILDRFSDDLLNVSPFDPDFIYVDTLTKFLNVKQKETDAGLELEISVPGFDSSTVDVFIDGDILTVKTLNKDEAPKTVCTFNILKKYDVTKIDAEVKNGLLKISIPKLLKEPKSKVRINVK